MSRLERFIVAWEAVHLHVIGFLVLFLLAWFAGAYFYDQHRRKHLSKGDPL